MPTECQSSFAGSKERAASALNDQLESSVQALACIAQLYVCEHYISILLHGICIASLLIQHSSKLIFQLPMMIAMKSYSSSATKGVTLKMARM